jgi:hypothetical protein
MPGGVAAPICVARGKELNLEKGDLSVDKKRKGKKPFLNP